MSEKRRQERLNPEVEFVTTPVAAGRSTPMAPHKQKPEREAPVLR
jgi:hypothetical protein